MQALSKSDDSVRLEFIAIVDQVKNIAQHLNDRIEAAVVSTKESDRLFASTLNEKEKEQQNMDEIDKATTEKSIEIKKLHRHCTIRRWNKKMSRQNKESLIQTKMEIDQPDLDAKERADRENKERLVRNIVNPTEGLTVNDQITFQDINLPEANIMSPLELPPNVNAIVDEITNNVLTKISQKHCLIYLNTKQ